MSRVSREEIHQYQVGRSSYDGPSSSNISRVGHTAQDVTGGDDDQNLSAHLNIIIVSSALLSPSSASTANRIGTIMAAVAALLIHMDLVSSCEVMLTR